MARKRTTKAAKPMGQKSGKHCMNDSDGTPSEVAESEWRANNARHCDSADAFSFADIDAGRRLPPGQVPGAHSQGRSTAASEQ